MQVTYTHVVIVQSQWHTTDLSSPQSPGREGNDGNKIPRSDRAYARSERGIVLSAFKRGNFLINRLIYDLF